jgi:hypothetical protein
LGRKVHTSLRARITSAFIDCAKIILEQPLKTRFNHLLSLVAATCAVSTLQITAPLPASSPTPTIATTGTLSAVNTTYGTASASPTSFSVSGSNLTADLTVTAPSGYEVSTSIGSGYGASLNLTQTGGSVASTTVYVRLTATAPVARLRSFTGSLRASANPFRSFPHSTQLLFVQA